MSLRSLPLLAVLALTACSGGDSDGDGLDNGEEKDLGTDPKKADSDDDGITDFDEVDLDLDPLKADSDDDGMTDGDELKNGFDPLDEESDGYEGGWPMQEVAVKDAIEADGKTGAVIAIGKRFKRFRLNDTHLDEVDLYDFAGHGKKVVIDVSAEWCGPCKLTAALISGQVAEADLQGAIDNETFFQKDVDNIFAMADAIANGEIYWITIVSQDAAGNGARAKTAKEWEEEFPNDAVPVLADPDQTMVSYVTNGVWPTMALLNENMTIVDIQSGWPGISPFYEKAFKGE